MLAGSAFAQMLAVVVHELATNATKYGSLSQPKGRVDVKWNIRGNDTFMFSWIERADHLCTNRNLMGSVVA